MTMPLTILFAEMIAGDDDDDDNPYFRITHVRSYCGLPECPHAVLAGSLPTNIALITDSFTHAGTTLSRLPCVFLDEYFVIRCFILPVIGMQATISVWWFAYGYSYGNTVYEQQKQTCWRRR